MRVPVWMDEWQYACCGAAAVVGAEVRRHLVWRGDDPWPPAVFGARYPDWKAGVSLVEAGPPVLARAGALTVVLRDAGGPVVGATRTVRMLCAEHDDGLPAYARTSVKVRRIFAVRRAGMAASAEATPVRSVVEAVGTRGAGVAGMVLDLRAVPPYPDARG